MGNKGDYLPMAVNMLGVITRLPGRFLASEDEFFKVISKRKVLYREAFRRKMITYEEAIRGGVDKETAKGMAKGGKMKMRSKGMAKGGAAGGKKGGKAMTVAQIRAAAKKKGYKLVKA